MYTRSVERYQFRFSDLQLYSIWEYDVPWYNGGSRLRQLFIYLSMDCGPGVSIH